MTKKKRTFIFLFLFLLFLIFAPTTVMYSLGWRFNWEEKKLSQPGMFYFKIWPKNAQVSIDEKISKRTDIFFGSVLIENLMPKNYTIKVTKEGYHSWEKTLEIKKREVTEAKNIILFPQNINMTALSEKVEDFFFYPDYKKIITKETDSSDEETTEWSLKIIDINKNIKSHLISQQDFRIGALTPKNKEKPENVELIDLKFSSSQKNILLTIGAKEQIYYFTLNLENKEIALLDFLKAETEKVFFHPKDEKNLLIKYKDELREVDIEKKEISSALANGIVALTVENKNIYYLNKEGFIFNSIEGDEKINILPFEIKKETEYEIIAENNNLFLRENSILYMFNKEDLFFEELFKPAKGFSFSPDKSKLAYFSEHEIWIIFLEKRYEQPQKEIGEKVFINRFSEKIDDLFWLTNYYLVFGTQDKIKICGTDDRSQINTIDLIELKNPKIVFSNKKLYILSEESLYVSDELTP